MSVDYFCTLLVTNSCYVGVFPPISNCSNEKVKLKEVFFSASHLQFIRLSTQELSSTLEVYLLTLSLSTPCSLKFALIITNIIIIGLSHFNCLILVLAQQKL